MNGVEQAIRRIQLDAEDVVVQTACSRAIQKLHAFREEARFSTWISCIFRRKRRATLLSPEEPMNGRSELFLTSREPRPEESTGRHEISTAISRALAKLPDNLRTPYELYAISGLPLVDVANRLGLSLSTTKSRILDLPRTVHARVPRVL